MSSPPRPIPWLLPECFTLRPCGSHGCRVWGLAGFRRRVQVIPCFVLARVSQEGEEEVNFLWNLPVKRKHQCFHMKWFKINSQAAPDESCWGRMESYERLLVSQLLSAGLSEPSRPVGPGQVAGRTWAGQGTDLGLQGTGWCVPEPA